MIATTRFAVPQFLPALQIEMTTACNLRCGGCARTIHLEQGTHLTKHIPLAGYRSVIATVPPTKVLLLSGNGEPTLHPDLLEMVAIARESGKFETITFYSNLLAHDLFYFLDLRRAGLNLIMVSIDSLTQEVADRCRAGTDVEELKRRVEKLALVFPFGISTVVSRDNMEDLPNTVAWLSTRFEQVRVDMQKLNPVPGRRDGRNPTLQPEDLPRFTEIIAQLRRKYPFVALNPNPDIWGEAPHKEACSMPFARPMVNCAGELCPCCFVADPEAYRRTNLFTLPFELGWRGDNVQHWLREFMEGSPEACRTCGAAYLPPGAMPRA